MTPLLLDTIVAIIILLSVVVAFFRGFVKEVLTIVNLVGSAAAAWFAGPSLVPTFRSWVGVPEDGAEKAEKIWGVIPPEIMANFLAYASVFFLAFIILMLAGIAISSSVKALGLGPIDRFLGMFFGAARGFLLVLLFYVPVAIYYQTPDKMPRFLRDSFSIDPVDSAYHWIKAHMDLSTDLEKVSIPADPADRNANTVYDVTDMLDDSERREP